jgi:hypothetical protein
MGRTPRTLLFVLFALVLQPATALGDVDGDGETTFKLPLQANHGLSARLEADDDEIQLTVRRGPQQEAVYSAPGEVSAEGISVDFGSLGEFVVTYKPFRTLETHGPNHHCEGEPASTTEGYFRGTMRFRGEGDYARIEASRVKGTLMLHPEWSCDYGRSRASQTLARTANQEATLVANSHRDAIRFGVLASRGEDGRPQTFFFAVNQEVREKVAVSRFTYASTRVAAGFRFDNRRGSAFADPPAPFAGFARYLRRPDAPDSWKGPLTVSLLGLGRVHLAGPDFRARMVPRLPEFE